jgi:hypothetical protein
MEGNKKGKAEEHGEAEMNVLHESNIYGGIV